ncbi:hypothetical protein ACF053_23555 [Streptomyces kanasensis]|uniref:hypothetical protein n=1 Tax=Streptomyces kanasensis TaxID=936756 RepID=UPI0037010620
MTLSRRIATGLVPFAVLAAVAAGTAPAGASGASAASGAAGTSGTAVAPERGAAAPVQAPAVAAGPCTGWKKAGSLPLKWSTVKDSCGHFGKPGMKMGYGWRVYKGSAICVRVKGFDTRGRTVWHEAGCGRTGSVRVPWGNAAANKEMKVKGGALFEWS